MKKILNFCIIAAFFITACTNTTPSDAKPVEPDEQIEANEIAEPQQTDKTNEEKNMANNKVAVVIARDRYQSLEFNPVVNALNDANYDIIIASDALGTATGTTENTEVEIAFADLNTDELMGIVLIGGSISLWDNSELHAILNRMNEDKKLVSAICYGSVTLAKAHVIGEGDIACWYNSPESDPVMESEGVKDSELDVTIEGNIITGDGPNAAEEFAQAIVDYLKNK